MTVCNPHRSVHNTVFNNQTHTSDIPAVSVVVANGYNVSCLSITCPISMFLIVATCAVLPASSRKCALMLESYPRFFTM